MVRRNEMRVDGKPQQSQTVLEIVLPNGLVPLEQMFAAPDVIYQNVEPAAFRSNPGDQRASTSFGTR